MTEHAPCVCVHELNRVSVGQTTTNSKTARLRGVCNLTQTKQHFLSLLLLLYCCIVCNCIVIYSWCGVVKDYETYSNGRGSI